MNQDPQAQNPQPQHPEYPQTPPPQPAQSQPDPQPQAEPQQPQPQPQPQPTEQQPVQPVQQPTQVVHVARSLEPQQPVISPEVMRLHQRSNRLYPMLNLSPGEFVIAAVRRHPIGIVVPLVIGTFLIAIVLSIFFSYDIISENLALTGVLADMSAIAIPVWIFVAIVALGMGISYYVYVNNKFFLTNESVIQEIQHSLFSRQEQTVSLANIEDASFTQTGILQQILNYGDIRLSTEGDETTYRFSYVSRPKEHIARLNNAVEAFKNGRPVDDN